MFSASASLSGAACSAYGLDGPPVGSVAPVVPASSRANIESSADEKILFIAFMTGNLLLRKDAGSGAQVRL